MIETDKMVIFKNGYLSNFYACSFNELDIKFNCTEQYYMYYKAKLFNDIHTSKLILESTDSFQIKKLGRFVKNFDENVWNYKRFNVMLQGNLHKFYQNKNLNDMLQNTGYKTLVEASSNDCIWGVGLSINDPLILDEKNWKGKNLLGQVLMKVRDDLR